MNGKLYLAATPIGNYDDITLRALNILKATDLIICEEFREARRLLAHFGITKELYALNEHNEKEAAFDVLSKLKGGTTAALISDCGTPLFSDPGRILVSLCISNNIEVIPLPGANSLMPALTASGLEIERFYYYGWLSPKKDLRRKELLKLKNIMEVIVLLDTPYRLQTLLTEIAKIFGDGQYIVLAFELTMKNEEFIRGKIGDILTHVREKSLKGEYVLIIDNKSAIRG